MEELPAWGTLVVPSQAYRSGSDGGPPKIHLPGTCDWNFVGRRGLAGITK